jgi:phosphate-selective porin
MKIVGMAGRGARLLRRSAVLLLAGAGLAGLAWGQDKGSAPAVTAGENLQLSGYAQVLYNYFDKGDDSFSISRARLSVSGGLLKNVSFKLQIDGVKSPTLLDAMIDVQFKPYLGLRVGQYYVPFGLESTTSDADLDLINRSQVVNSLAPGRDIGSQGRDIGAMLMGKYSFVEYYAGIFNGSGINRLDTNKNKDFAARVIVRPIRNLAVGGSFYDGRYSATQDAPVVTRNKAGLEAALTLGALCLKSEFISAKDDRTSKSGWYAEGTYFLLPNKVQAVVRWDAFDPNLDTVNNRQDAFTVGGTWFLFKRTKILANYILNRVEGQGTTNQTLAVQFQAAF